MLVRAKRGNEIWQISGGEPYYRLFMTGVGISPIHRYKRRGAQQDGATDRGFRIEERILNMGFLFNADTYAQADAYRDLFAEIFKPTDIPLQIEVTRKDGAIRQIDTHVIGAVDFPDTPTEDRMGTSQRIVVQLEAANPTWYDPITHNLIFDAVESGTSGMLVPIEVPIVIGPSASINATQAVNYKGTWREFPRIFITGPATNPVITNLSTGEKLDFTGAAVPAGQIFEIDLRYEFKTITNSSGVSQTDKLTDDSDHATWHLAPTPFAPDGVNDIRIQAANGTSETRVRMLYFDRYISL